MQQSLNTGKFKAVDERTSPEAMPAESLTVLQNMVLDNPIYTPTMRKGFSRWNQAIGKLTSTGGLIQSLYDLVDTNQNNVMYAAISDNVHGQSIVKSIYTGVLAAWANVKTGLSTSALKARILNYAGKFLISNDIDVPFYTDNTTVWNMALPQPDTSSVVNTPTVITSGLNGSYRYILVYITNDGQHSNPSTQIAQYYLGFEFNGVNMQTNFTGLPVSSDTRIVSKKIFRTKSNILSKFYLVTTLDNSVTTFSDSLADANLDTTETIEYTNTPNTFRYMATQSDIIFLANIQKQLTNIVIPPAHINTSSSNIISTQTAGVYGNLAPGNYDYAYSYQDANNKESQLVYLTNYTVTGTAGTYWTVTLWNFAQPYLNLTTSSAGITGDKNIKYINFYRAVGGSGIYKYIGQISALNQNTFIDTSGGPGILYPFVDHFFSSTTSAAIDFVTLSSSIIFSNLFNYLEYPEVNYIEIFPDDGDKINGIFDDDNGIMIFKDKSICKLYTNGDSSNWQVVKLSTNIGCDQPDSIYKLGHSYFFVFRNRPYLFSGSGEPEEIGLMFPKTFDSVTSFLGATYYTKNEWFVLNVKIGSAPYLLCYDLKLKTWYKFTMNEADTISRKEFGADAGKLLVGGDSQYLNVYDENLNIDTVLAGTVTTSGSLVIGNVYVIDAFVTGDNFTNVANVLSGTVNVSGCIFIATGTTPTTWTNGSSLRQIRTDIVTFLTSKTFSFKDDFMLARLRYLFLDYIRLNGTTPGNAELDINDIDSNTALAYVDSTDGSGLSTIKTSKSITDALGTLKTSKKLNFSLSGTGILQLNAIRLDYREIRHGMGVSQ